MQTLLDIPDNQYQKLAARAKREGMSVSEVVLRGIEKELVCAAEPEKMNRLSAPLLKSYAPDSIRLSNEQIYDLIGFP